MQKIDWSEQFSNVKIRRKEADERIMERKGRSFQTDTIEMNKNGWAQNTKKKKEKNVRRIQNIVLELSRPGKEQGRYGSKRINKGYKKEEETSKISWN
jgi:hypothetical protein